MSDLKKMEKIAGAISDEELDALVSTEHVSGETTPICAAAVSGAIGAISQVIAATLGSGNCPTKSTCSVFCG